MKVVVQRLLEEAGIAHQFVIGIHDTDYFAKAHASAVSDGRFQLLPHNDGRTRELWSAAGEISRLFGAECIPSRSDFTQYGVPLRAVLQEKGAEKVAFLDEVTEAWGWRGLVDTGSENAVVCELKLGEVMPGIRAMLEYGFSNTIQSIETPTVAEKAQALAKMLLNACCDCCRSDPNATLPTLYQAIYPVVLRHVAGRDYPYSAVTSTSQLLRFNTETCHLPRFRIVNVFLQPRTRSLAEMAYNSAVQDSEMYTLDRFGVGALPFDVVLPGRGRGTLRVTLRGVHIETREPVFVRTPAPVQDVTVLARILEDRFGDGVILVGKAVTLIAMLAAEYIFVFNEHGSVYITRTRAMQDYLRSHGVTVNVHPVLRLRYRTWDSAEVVDTVVSLPDHMKRTFGCQSLPMRDFARQWRQVVAEQEGVLQRLQSIRSPRRLLEYLQERCPGRWKCAARRYSDLTRQLLLLVQRHTDLWQEARVLYAELAQVRSEIAAAEKACADHFRSVHTWTPEETARRQELSALVAQLHRRRRDIAQKIANNRARRIAVGRTSEFREIRDQRRQLALEAENARLLLVRDAILVTRGLPHTNFRPTAWWLPFLDPTGQWFREVARTTTAYLEPLVSL